MSEPELAYANDDFDLPRWQTQAHHDSSAAQHPHTVPQSSYLYSGVPPPPPAQRLAAIHQSNTGQSRQPRISQLLDDQQNLAINSSPYLSTGHSQLSRSASLGGAAAANTATSRVRRHHPTDDLEGAFHTEPQGISVLKQHSQSGAPQHHPSTSFYPSSVGYHTQTLPGTSPVVSTTTSPTGDYTDMYYNGSTASKRSQNTLDTNTSARTGRSPLHAGTTLLDPYSQQAQYSPTTATYSYPPPSDQRTQQPYHSHSRAHSLIKTEALTPPISAPYSPHSTMHSPSIYSSPYAMDTTSPHPSAQAQAHLTAHVPVRSASASTPNTPLSYNLPSQNSSSQYFPQDQPMLVETPQKRRASGLRRVRDARDLRPRVDNPPAGRRMDSTGVYLSPLRQLTTNILETYHICNPLFRYESTHNPRRVLTKPSKPAHNEGYDNDDYDYILYVNDWLGTDDGHKYLILDILGQGTFGQVVKCQNMKTHEIVAVKVVKNKPAYFNQSMMEVTILELLNKTCDPNDEHHILRLRDSFIHRSHLCLVFELLSSNLYELIKQNQFQGLSTQLVKVFMAQLLDAMTVLKEARLIHCDLKPENILLKSLQSPQIKVIDFGSACHERQTVYSYIQSRFYRSPEVLLGMSYTASIDMWSLGCIAVELFLGLPLFPGTSEYNQITRIVEMLGMPPPSMLNTGKQTNQFFDSFEVYNHHMNQNEKKFRLKSLEQYSREHNTNEQPGKQYFKANTLPEIINTAPMPTFKSSSRQGHEVEKELNNRASFIDFCQGLLNLNPVTRWTPQQARLHPFITGEKWTKPFSPDGPAIMQVTPSPSSSNVDPKRPYGGLVPSQPKGTRAYQDAATYNHQLAQHQAYTAQAQAASQAANNAFRNPYIAQQQNSQPPPPAFPQPQDTSSSGYSQYSAQQPSSGHRGLAHQTSTGQLNSTVQYPNHPPGAGVPANTHLNPNPPSNSYFPNSRARANTINQMDSVPPALARLQHMNQDVIAGRNALTPVLNRDDAMREWERRQAGKPSTAQPYPQLEYLQQQAELAAASGLTSWAQQSNNSARYPPPSKLAQSYHPQTIMVDEDSRRDAVMSNVRSAARNEGPNSMYSPGVITSPPQAYNSNATTSGNRYAATYTQQTPTSPFDSLDRRTDIGNLFVPMQSDSYQPYAGPGGSSTAVPSRHVVPPPQAVAPSFYGSGVPTTGPTSGTQRNPFSVADGAQQGTKESRRGSGMDLWPR